MSWYLLNFGYRIDIFINNFTSFPAAPPAQAMIFPAALPEKQTFPKKKYFSYKWFEI